MKLRRIICFFLGHRSMLTFVKVYTYSHDNSFEGELINTCERCGHEQG